MYGLSFRLRVLYRTVHLKPSISACHKASLPIPAAFSSDSNLCMIFGSPLRPKVLRLQPGAEMCGSTRQQAITYLLELEALTAP